MTLQEAKDQVANQYQYSSWDVLDFYAIDELRGTTTPPYAEERLWHEAAELYARSKWDEACLATRLDDGRFIFSGVSPSEIDQDFYARPRLNFKP